MTCLKKENIFLLFVRMINLFLCKYLTNMKFYCLYNDNIYAEYYVA